jgi:hypothetical protein
VEINRIGGDLIIRFDNQQEAAALHAVLSGHGHAIDQRAAEFGNWMYRWFFDAVHRLATQYDEETKGLKRTITPRNYIHPGKGTVRSLP